MTSAILPHLSVSTDKTLCAVETARLAPAVLMLLGTVVIAGD